MSFPNIAMYILNIVSAIKQITVKELKDFIFGDSYEKMGFGRENSYYSMKYLKKRICN